jgi:hypothetical protein
LTNQRNTNTTIVELKARFKSRDFVEQMEALRKTMEMIQYKCWYYETAVEAGSEAAPGSVTFDDLPETVRNGKAELERSLAE